MSPEIVQQFQQIVATMKKITEASGALAEKVESLERRSDDSLGAFAAIQNGLQTLLTNYESHAQLQTAVNTQLADAVARLEARIAVLEGQGPVM